MAIIKGFNCENLGTSCQDHVSFVRDILHKVKLNLTAPLPDTTPANKNATGCSPSQDRLGLAQRELSDTVLRPRNGKYVLKVNRICQNIHVVQEQRKCTHF